MPYYLNISEYPLGKTPLTVRIERYIEFFKPTDGLVPIHPKDAEAADKLNWQHAGHRLFILGCR